MPVQRPDTVRRELRPRHADPLRNEGGPAEQGHERDDVGQWINPNRIGELLNSNRKFGIVEIDWSTADPEIHLEIYDGLRRHLDHVVRLSELQPAA